jgi:signal transduction histidine kinase
VLEKPSWWTPRHVTYVFGAVAVGLLLVTGVVMLLTHRRLNEQTRRRAMAEGEFAAILAERNRVAREIHDTLAQGLAATSVHLRLARKLAPNNPDSLNHHLDVAQQLVGDSLEEARNSIWNMRSHVLENGDLAGALRGILQQLAGGADLDAQVEIRGRARRFSPVTENNILRIGQEAITNATRHAQARQIRVSLDFGERQFELRVTDDGRGFDPQQPLPDRGGFGLVGLRERAAELKGDLQIRSAPGQGTDLKLCVPLAGESNGQE